jgi:ADP-ribosyl-[dinitrogen reductase] hydrolase
MSTSFVSSPAFDAETGQIVADQWILNRALGALIGACIGDATGAPLERLGRFPTESDVRNGMNLSSAPRTGPRVSSGSLVTDDSEMTIALANALAECCRRSELAPFDLEIVAEKYAEWVQSSPPDMGLTVGAGIGVARSKQTSFVDLCAREGFALQMQRGARFDAKTAPPSQSNGQLMRSSPLALFARHLDDDALRRLVHLDCSLSHINPICADASMVYCVALREILRHRECSGAGAFAVAHQWAREHAGEEVRGWVDAVAAGDVPPAWPNAGFVKVALSISLSRLKQLSTAEAATEAAFTEMIHDVLLAGGDTDTNACIAGALVGALVGFNALPRNWRGAVLGHRSTRPASLHPLTLIDTAMTLVERAPTSWSETPARTVTGTTNTTQI